MMQSPIRKAIFSFLVIVALAGLLLTIYGGKKKTIRRPLKLPDDMIMTGQTLNHYSQGKKIYSLKIEKIRVGRKKIGFIKIGFMKVAEIKGFEMDLFQDNIDATKGSSVYDDFSRYFGQSTELEGLLSQYNVMELTFEDIKVNVERKGKTMFALHSKIAVVDGKTGSVTFKGLAEITTSKKSVKADKITWQRSDRNFLVPGLYELTENGNITNGKCMKTDYQLKNIQLCEGRSVL